MRVVKTFGRGAKAAATQIEMVEQRSAVSTARVEPTVRSLLMFAGVGTWRCCGMQGSSMG
jgi:hypothetical protein